MRALVIPLCILATAYPSGGSASSPEIVESWWWHRQGEVPVGVVRELVTHREDGGWLTEETGENRPWSGGAEKVYKWMRRIEENAEGEITSFSTESAGPDSFVMAEGSVDGDSLDLTVTEHGKEAKSHEVKWPGGILGPVGIVTLRRAKGFAAGTRYRYLAWDFDSWRTVSYEAHVEVARVRVDGPGGAPAAARIAVWPISPKGAVLLEWWADGQCLRRWTKPVGDESRVRVDRDMATGRGAGVIAAYSVSEIAKLVGRSIPIPRPSACTKATYRLSLTDGKWGEIETSGPHQKAKRAAGGWALQVTAAKLPKSGHPLPLKVPTSVEPGLQDGYYVGLEGDALPALARDVVGGERSGAKAVRKIVAAVAARLRPTALNAGMATALEAWRQREGDCMEQSACVVALCRAVGVPARLAGGLRFSAGRLQYHVWAEVWLGKWYGVDAMTPGQACDAARIRFGTGWLGDQTPEEALLQVGTVVKRLEVEVVHAVQGKRRLGGETARVQERLFEDPTWDVRIASPKDWKLTGRDPSVEATIAVAHGRRGRRINIRAGTVALHETAWDLARNSGFRVDNPIVMGVDGVDALVADLSRSGGRGYSPRTAYLVDGETLFVVEYGGRADDGFAAFEQILANWRWLTKRGK